MAAPKIYIVEDEPMIRENIRIALEAEGYQISGFSDEPEKALLEIKDKQPDLVLLDINLSAEKDGIWLGNQINETLHLPFIFLTSYSDKITLDLAKKSMPAGYIVKPFSEVDLRTNIEIVLARITPREEEKADEEPLETDYFFVKKDGDYVKVVLDEIHCIEALDNYAMIYLEKNRLTIRSTLKQLLSKIPSNKLIRCHRSHAINMAKIQSLGSNYLIVNNKTVPIGSNYREELVKRLVMI